MVPAGDAVREVIPFLHVTDMERSTRFYLDGLGFSVRNRWVKDGRLRWCLLALGGAQLMLQELAPQDPARELGMTLGAGVSLEFICTDAVAIYHEAKARGLQPSEPQVGNGLWVTGLRDPDGYRLEFESPTDAPEEAKLSDVSP